MQSGYRWAMGTLAALVFITVLLGRSPRAQELTVNACVSGQTNLQLDFDSSMEKYYQVWAAPSLTSEWTEVRGLTLGTNGMLVWEDAGVVNTFTSLYYRVRELYQDSPDDYDQDGIDDVYELTHEFLDPRDALDSGLDQESDGLTNLEEYQWGTDPESSDSDGDGLPDGWEVAGRSDPLDATDTMYDADGDGVGAYYEYINGSDPTNAASRPTATWFVDAAAPGGGDGSEGSPFNNIQAAIQAASSNDIIELADGTYSGAGNYDVDYNGKAVLVTSTNGAEYCVVDCQGLGRGFRFVSNECWQAVLSGITICNGSKSSAGAVSTYFSAPTIQRCVLTSNTVSGSGGALYVTAGHPSILECVFRDNVSQSGYGGAVMLYGVTNALIRDCEISGNACYESGGGLYSQYAKFTVEDTVFDGNTAQERGGGIGFESYSTSIVKNCHFEGNTATSDGGGISLMGYSRATMSGVIITNNHAEDHGGGLFMSSAYGSISNAMVTGNSAGDYGGAVCLLSAHPAIKDCLIRGNTAASGGGVHGSSSSPSIYYCRITDNRADFGGGVNTVGGTMLIRNTLVAGNRADAYGGGLRCDGGAAPKVWNCTIAGNQSPFAGGGHYGANSSRARFENCIIRDNGTVGVDNYYAQFSYCVLEEYTYGNGNQVADPMLVPGSCRLTASSPAIDAGMHTNAPNDDIDREGRVDLADHSNVVSVVDIGFDEFVDSDGDDMADAWEVACFTNLSYAGGSDSDSDGLINSDEYERGTDPHTADSDGDGLTDGEEVHTRGTHPAMVDTDGDGIPDGWELSYGFDPLNEWDALADQDGDGFDALYEYLHESNPTNQTSVPSSDVMIYVDPLSADGGDGTQASPFNNILAAVAAADEYDVVILADGVYTGSSNHSITCAVKSLLITSTNGADNCIIDCESNGRVFRFVSQDDRAMQLRGVTIRGGYWSGNGGAIYCDRTRMLISDCVLETNYASQGGALYCKGGDPVILNTVIRGNLASRGGGVYCYASHPLFRNCLMERQYVSENGGFANCTQRSMPGFENCLIADNQAGSNGGGCYTDSSSAPGFIRCRFLRNEAEVCGGAVRGDYGGWVMMNCFLAENRAQYGGAQYIRYHGMTNINCTIINNDAEDTGGMYTYVSVSLMQNTIVWGNSDREIYGQNYMTISHCDIQGGCSGSYMMNEDPQIAPRSYRLTAGSPCIDRGVQQTPALIDLDGELPVDDPDHANPYSIVDLGCDEFVDTDHDDMGDAWEIDSFQDLSHDGAADGDMTGGADGLTDREEYERGTDPNVADTDGDGLLDGDEVNVHTTDPLQVDTDADDMADGWEVDNELNPLDGCDMASDLDEDNFLAVFEFMYSTDPNDPEDYPGPTKYVDAAASSGGDGSLGAPHQTLAQALSAAKNYEIIEVADGLYMGSGNRNLSTAGKALILSSTNGPEHCVIDCEYQGPGFNIEGEEKASTIIKGFTVQHGGTNWCGGGIEVYNTYGDCSPVFSDMIVKHCVSSGSGGGIGTYDSPAFRNCLVVSNKSLSGGGGVYLAANAVLENSRVEHNHAVNTGGGISGGSTGVVVRNCFVIGNESENVAGGYWGAGQFINVTFYHNTARNGGSVGGADGGGASFLNCIAWDNPGSRFYRNAPSPIEYSNLDGSYAGAGNISVDPEFVPGSGRLRATSPCIDAGTETNALDQDIEGEDRWDDPAHVNVVGLVDMGADEFVDTDADQIADAWELELVGDLSVSATSDNDEDGLTDLDEFNMGTLPDNPDTDGDGVSDGDEVNVHGSSPLDVDTDRDGMDDEWEVLNAHDPCDGHDALEDLDGDGFTARYEYHHGTEPTNRLSRPVVAFYVDGAAATGGDGSLAAPFNTIQAAVSAVTTSFAVVEMADGLYSGSGNRNINYGGRTLMLYSTNGRENCVIDCLESGRAFVFQNGETNHALVSGVTVKNGRAGYGGAVYIDSAWPMLRDCRFTDNRASDRGGAVWITGYGAPIIQGCCIQDNESDTYGGGLGATADSHPYVLDSQIINNIGNSGGGVYIGNDAVLLMQRCLVEQNQSRSGGGIFYASYSAGTLEDVVFRYNGSSTSGGGVYSKADYGSNFRRCSFEGNYAGLNGGALYCYQQHAYIRACSFVENQAAEDGGAIYVYQGRNYLDNCTLWNNLARKGRAVYFHETGSGTRVRNCIVWGHEDLPFTYRSAQFAVSYSVVEGGYKGTNNITDNPLLLPDARLHPSSPCIDAGSDTYAPSYDWENEERWDDPGHANLFSVVDIGADEYVDSDGDQMADTWELTWFGDMSHDGTADGDTDGLTDTEEYAAGTLPNNADTDGDGMPDGWELNNGYQPGTADAAVETFAFLDNFSGDYYLDGFMHGQNGWGVYPVDAGIVFADRLLRLDGGAISRYLGDRPGTSVWYQVRMIPAVQPAAAATTSLQPLNLFYVDPSQYLVVQDGANWQTSAVSVAAGTWHNFTVAVHYSNQLWGLYLDGQPIAEGLSLPALAETSTLTLDRSHGVTWLHSVAVYTNRPDSLDVDTDEDGMPDAWETAFGFNPAVSDANDDADLDGVANGLEFIIGTSPTSSDSDLDGIPDGWELDNGWDPLARNQLEPIPYSESFADCVMGDLNRQQHWSVVYDAPVLNAPGAIVQDNEACSGGDRLALRMSSELHSLSGGAATATAVRCFQDINATSLWMDVYVQPAPGMQMALGALIQLSVSPSNEVLAWDGLLQTNQVLAEAWPTGSWCRLTMYVDRASGLWDAYVTNHLVRAGLGVAKMETPEMLYLAVRGGEEDGYVDSIALSLEAPTFIDADGDGLSLSTEVSGYTDPDLFDSDGDGLTDGYDGYVSTNDYPGGVDTNADGFVDGELDAGTSAINPDTDGDGMPDGWEWRHGLNPHSNDADGHADSDVLTNYEEFLAGTDPLESDTDGDGMPDDWEVQYRLNPLDATDAAEDADGDDLSNLEEYTCSGGSTNPRHYDTDSDGMPDGWEVQYGFNPLIDDAADDTDGDGILAYEEYVAGSSPVTDDSLLDTDSDSINDAQEIMNGTNPALADTDGDGLTDDVDVNPTVPDGCDDANGPIIMLQWVP